MNKNRLLTLKNVAKRLQLSERTVYRYIQKRELKSIRFSRKATRISEKDLESFIKKHKNK